MANPEENMSGHEFHGRQEWNLEGGRLWLAVVLAILVAAAGYSFLRMSSEEQHRAELQRTNQALQASLDQAKTQLQTAAEQINAANTRAQTAQLQQAAPSPAEQVAEPGSSNAVAGHSRGQNVKAKHALTARSGGTSRPAHRADDPRWGEMNAKLAEQQKQIDSTRSDIDKTRSDMEGQLSSTRDELNGSIARTHDDVVALRKRGERNYYEFDLNKSSSFERTGPVSLQLRKTNVKHRYFDIAMIVDDQKLEKKHVNLYEPVWVNLPDRAEPVQLVVNSISKSNVKGYLSEPKYKKSELARVESANAATPNASSSQQLPVANTDSTKPAQQPQ